LIYLKFENKKNQIKVTAFRVNIIPRNINANFLPINAVSGSSFTLIKFSNYTAKVSINKHENFSLKEKLVKLLIFAFSGFENLS
tara:strand:- start:211 stop:462 length:252 start_codon:yes stop_codon:yes gene_type:complete